MKIGDIVKTKYQKLGKIVDISITSKGKKMYSVDLGKYIEPFFKEGLEKEGEKESKESVVEILYNLFEVIQVLYKDQSKKAISKKGEIKWIKRTLDNPSKDNVKDLVYINANGFDHNIMRDIVLESLNCKIWTIC